MNSQKEETIKSILNFLHTHEYFKSLISLELESSINLNSYGKELDFFYTLLIEGRFNDAEKFILPLKARSESNYKIILYQIRKQHFLESLEASDTPNLQELVGLLKEIELLSEKEDFSELCQCLSLNKITDHPQYSTWDIWSGRIKCFEECLKYLSTVYSLNEAPKPKFDIEKLIRNQKEEKVISFTEENKAEESIDEFEGVINWEETSEEFNLKLSRFDPSELKELASVSDYEPIRACAFNTPGDFFVLGTNSKSIKVCSLQGLIRSLEKDETPTEYIKVVLEMKNIHYGSVYCIDWSPNGTQIATGSNDKSIKITYCPDFYYLQTQYYETLEYDGKFLNCGEPPIYEKVLRGRKGTIRSLCYLPFDDRVLASGGTVDTEISIWDTDIGKCCEEYKGHEGAVYSIAAGSDELASVGTDKKIRIWDIRASKLVLSLNSEKFEVMNSVEFNERTLGVGHTDGAVSVWDLVAGKLFTSYKYHSDECRSVDFSPNGNWLLSSGFDGSLGIVDISDEEIYKLECHSDKIISAKWHPTFPVILSTSADKTAKVFSV